MNSIESIMFQLTSGLISETAIPNEYIVYPEVLAAIQRYNWSVAASNVQGWTRLIRIVNYSS